MPVFILADQDRGPVKRKRTIESIQLFAVLLFYRIQTGLSSVITWDTQWSSGRNLLSRTHAGVMGLKATSAAGLRKH